MAIAIIGGGLTGCLVALEAADRGARVVVFDAATRLLSRASTGNEGKIHLGYVYGADTSFRTAARLIDDALMFRPVLERWIGAAAFEACLGDTFAYVVPPCSALPAPRVEAHFKAADRYLAARVQATGLRYLGQDCAPVARIPPGETRLNGAVFSTPERVVWPVGIARAIERCVLNHPRIETVLDARVDRVVETGGAWRVAFAEAARPTEGPFERVVNAAWADRSAIDARSGHTSKTAWYTRFKFGVVLRDAAARMGGRVPANTTATSGSYGDSVYYPQNDTLYCSWYPVGMCHATTEAHDDARVPRPAVTEDQMRATWRGYAEIDPDFAALAGLPGPLDCDVVGDFIMARGASDIDDPQSRLHERSDHEPVELRPGYWTVETGKYTSSARCAVTCVAAMLGDV